MAIVFRSAQRLWAPLAIIVGAVLASAGVPPYQPTGNERSIADPKIASSGAPIPSMECAANEEGRIFTVGQVERPLAARECSKSNDGPCVCSSSPIVNARRKTSHRVLKSHLLGAMTTVRVAFDGGVRLTRLQSNSAVHWGDHFPDYFVNMPLGDPSDDGTSKDPDDDDTPNDLNGYHETHVLFMAWIAERSPYLITPDRTGLPAWIDPRSSTFLIVQRLRC
jgi:hypothetical protein